MAKKNLLVDLDLNLNQLLNAKLQNLAVPPVTTSWTGINLGFTYFNTTDKKVYVWDGTTWTISNVPANLDYTPSATNGTITNTNGTNATLPVAIATTAAGLLSGADKAKLDGIAAGASVNVTTNLSYVASATNGVVHSSDGADATIPVADTTNAGLLAPADKVKLNTAILTTTTDVSAAAFVLTDTTLAANSTTKVPTQNAVKTYVDSLILSYGALVFQGSYDAATNAPLLDVTPVVGIKKGWTYVVTVAGSFFTENVEAGDMIIAKINTPILLTDWVIVNKNIPDVLTTLLAGYAVGTNTALGTGDSILVAFGKIQAQLNNKITMVGGSNNFVPKRTGTGDLANSQIYDDGANIGLNTITPLSKLHLKNTASTDVYFTVENDLGATVFGHSSGGTGIIAGGYTSELKFGFNALSSFVERMALKTNGNLILGFPTDNGVDKLQVNGSIKGTSFVGSGATLTGLLTVNGGASDTTIIKGQNNGTESFTLDKNGYLKASRYELFGGLATQFLKADGTTDSSTYALLNAVSGLAGTIPKFKTGGGLEASQITESANFVVVGGAGSYTDKFEVIGNVKAVAYVGSGSLLTGMTKSQVGLSNVDNTSDANKPVSTATQTALNLKANLASPALTGVPTAPTAAVNTNTTQLATTAFVMAQGYGTVKKTAPTLIGNGVATTYVVSHGFGADAIAQARYASDNSVVDCEMLINSGGTVTFNFNLPVASNSIKVVIVG